MASTPGPGGGDPGDAPPRVPRPSSVRICRVSTRSPLADPIQPADRETPLLSRAPCRQFAFCNARALARADCGLSARQWLRGASNCRPAWRSLKSLRRCESSIARTARAALSPACRDLSVRTPPARSRVCAGLSRYLRERPGTSRLGFDPPKMKRPRRYSIRACTREVTAWDDDLIVRPAAHVNDRAPVFDFNGRRSECHGQARIAAPHRADDPHLRQILVVPDDLEQVERLALPLELNAADEANAG
jgi:hypothetical protein